MRYQIDFIKRRSMDYSNAAYARDRYPAPEKVARGEIKSLKPGYFFLPAPEAGAQPGLRLKAAKKNTDRLRLY